jgi:HK97 family phage major capsid protein
MVPKKDQRNESDLSFKKRELTSHPLATYCKASKKLIRLSTMDVGAFIADQLSYSFAVAEENALLNGSGTGQLLGVFTASALGTNTDRDVSTDNTATQIRADNLIECIGSLKAQYRASKSCRWIFSRAAVKQIRKLKDSSGDYLWNMGIAAGLPSTILDIPYVESEYAPSTFTTGLYVGILGEFRFGLYCGFTGHETKNKMNLDTTETRTVINHFPFFLVGKSFFDPMNFL